VLLIEHHIHLLSQLIQRQIAGLIHTSTKCQRTTMYPG
jgi:hypothetical protein